MSRSNGRDDDAAQQDQASDDPRGEQPRFKSNRPRGSRLMVKGVGQERTSFWGSPKRLGADGQSRWAEMRMNIVLSIALGMFWHTLVLGSRAKTLDILFQGAM